jgi:hypothetical protein
MCLHTYYPNHNFLLPYRIRLSYHLIGNDADAQSVRYDLNCTLVHGNLRILLSDRKRGRMKTAKKTKGWPKMAHIAQLKAVNRKKSTIPSAGQTCKKTDTPSRVSAPHLDALPRRKRPDVPKHTSFLWNSCTLCSRSPVICPHRRVW